MLINNLNNINCSLSVGDYIYYNIITNISGQQVVNGTNVLGEVTEVNDNSIGFNYTQAGLNQNIINSIISTPSLFITFKKNRNIESSSLKGYFASCNFINNDYKNKNELFAVSSDIEVSSK